MMNDISTAADAVRYAAARLGFSACRITDAQEIAHAGDFLSWVDGKQYAGMEWFAKSPARRCDPRIVLPGCASVIMLAYDYGNDWHRPPAPHIARYAWGDDYHPIIESKLADLDETLQIYGGTQRYYVDTGPVMERHFAEKSGMGWRGRNGILIKKKGGSGFFLACVLTTLHLPADTETKPSCGTCRTCIQTCPTGALLDNGQIDIPRCISYLTIEHKGSIPVELRPLMGTRIYGCDECQKQCPWNRKTVNASDSRFYPSRELRSMRLEDYLALDDAEFARLFQKSPVKRIKRERLLRNVCVALGNSGTVQSIDYLTSIVAPGDLVGEHADWAINRIKSRNERS